MFENVVVGADDYQAGRAALEFANALLAREVAPRSCMSSSFRAKATQTRAPVRPDSTGNSSFVLTDPRTIESDVRDALQRDARIKRPELIAISVDMIGTVVLGGTVATICQRRAAVHDARRIDGVFEVIDHGSVHPPVGPLRTDDEIRAAALRRLKGDCRIHAEQIASRSRAAAWRSPDTSGTHPSGCTPKTTSRAWTAPLS